MKFLYISPTVAGIFSIQIITPIFAAVAFNPQKHGSLFLPGLNATSLDVPPDSRFRIHRAYSGDEIVKNDCLVVGFWLMGQLSTKDWSSKIPFARGPHLANFPRVNIDIEPQASFPDLPIRYAIWGLKLAILDLLARDQFVESIYELCWNDLSMGTIHIQAIQDIEASTPRQSLDAKVNNQSLTVPFVLNQPVSLAIQIIPGAQRINPRDIWTTMFESQEQLAYPEAYLIPKTAVELGPFLPSNKAFFNIDPLHGPDLPRLYPPFLHLFTLTYALMLLVLWMCQNDHFSAFGFTISVSGTLVGTGRLDELRTQDLPPSSSGLAGNVSTS